MTIENINVEEIIKDAKLILFKYDINLLYPEEQIDDIILLIIICFPKMQKSKSHLFLGFIMVIYLFIIDDITDKYENFNKIAFKLHNEEYLNFENYENNKIYKFIYYVKDLLRKTLNLFNYELLKKEVLIYISSEIYKNKIDKKSFNNIQDYLKERVINICIIPFIIIIFDSLNYDYPKKYDKDIKNSITIISIMQDIYSYEKEKDDNNECYNSIKVMKKEKQIEDNIDYLLNICKKNIIETCNINNIIVKEILLNVQTGNALWGTISKRYNFIKKSIIKIEKS